MGKLVLYGKAAFPGLAALFFVWTVLSGWTLGFTAFTSYSYVVESADPLPKVPPAIPLFDQNGEALDLSGLKGKFHLLTFGYLECSGTCPVSMAEFLKINEQLQAQGRKDLGLLTLTLAPERDTEAMLHLIWQRFGEPAGWRLASPGAVDRQAYWGQLVKMGIWVDQDAKGYPIHDNRSFLINPQGLLVRTFAGVPGTTALLQAISEEGG